jgi:hypothetical protein
MYTFAHPALLAGQMMKSKKTEITEKLRQEINKVARAYTR